MSPLGQLGLNFIYDVNGVFSWYYVSRPPQTGQIALYFIQAERCWTSSKQWTYTSEANEFRNYPKEHSNETACL